LGGVYAMKNKYIGLDRKPERKSQTDRSKRRWDANIKTYIVEAGKEIWIGFTQLRLGASGWLL
jgi:hypothetical protein